jgi:CheY-like chemotaxis protein
MLFTDIIMPGMNGRQLADRALEMRPDLPVLFTTGYTRNAVVHNGMLDIGVAFLPKPYTVRQLAWKVREVLDAGFEYVEKSGRRLSIEYALIRDINDQAWRGDRLGRLLKGKPVHVNLIPLNPTPGSKWTASRPEDEKAFVEAIAAHGVPVTVRDTRGQEIDGACGQLAATER